MKALKVFKYSLIIAFSIILLSCMNGTENKIGLFSNSYDDLVGGYSFENNGQSEFLILKKGSDYYLQFSDSSLPEKVKMTKVSNESCNIFLGKGWEPKLISGLELGAFHFYKVKEGCLINGEIINSGFYGGGPGATQIWKVQ